MKNLILILFVDIVAVGFSQKNTVKYYELETPPGTIKIDSNLFIDKTEITNFSYLEFMYWTKRVFGANSKKYVEILPDTLVWRNKTTEYEPFVENYLYSPWYRDYPVVGISQKQARLFNKWRSDRVYELLLVKYGVIEFKEEQDSNNYFTIENYLNGKYFNYIANKEYTICPSYSLPNKREWLMGMNYFAKNNKIKKCSKAYCPLNFNKGDTMEINYNFKESPNEKFEPLKSTRCIKNIDLGTHFYGNVSEWLKEENFIIGGSWKDSTKIHFNEPIENNKATEYIGFRSVCKWVEYKQ